jgi:hypothetical protein
VKRIIIIFIIVMGISLGLLGGNKVYATHKPGHKPKGKPTEPVPEPCTVAIVGGGSLYFAWRLKKRLRGKKECDYNTSNDIVVRPLQ